MIRVYVNEDMTYPENALNLMITGHANKQVCAATGALWRAMINELAAAGKLYPKQIKVMYSTNVKKKKR